MAAPSGRCTRILQPLNEKGQAFEGVVIKAFAIADWQNKIYASAATLKKQVLLTLDLDSGALDTTLKPLSLLECPQSIRINRKRIYFCDGKGIEMGLRMINTEEEAKKGKLKCPYVRDQADKSYLESEVFEITERRIYSTNTTKINLYNNENPDHVELIRVLVGQEAKISAMFFLIDRLYVGGVDGEMGQWSKNGEKLKIWKAHKAQVTSITSDGEVVFSASKDKTVKIWSKTCDLLHEFSIDCGISRIQVAKGVIYLGTEQGDIYVCNAKGDIVAKFVPNAAANERPEPTSPSSSSSKGKKKAVRALEIHENKLYTSLPPFDAIHEWDIKALEELTSASSPEVHAALASVAGTPNLDVNTSAGGGCEVM